VHDQSLTLFLERFSHNTRVYPGDPNRFVSELLRRWSERRPRGVQSGGAEVPVSSARTGSGEVFVSYSRDDIDAARALAAELEEIGAGVTWFDKTQLTPGDEWDAEIKAALKRCDFFFALISAHTETRDESYFYREWRDAEDRSRGISRRKFIIPVVVDPVYSGNARDYECVPEGFFAFQFAHAPGGHMNDDLRRSVKEALRELERRRRK